ncbi:HAD-IC family P-type ATPase, partial [Duganella callida]
DIAVSLRNLMLSGDPAVRPPHLANNSDYPATAQAIAAAAGLPAQPVLSGAQLQALDDAALRAVLPAVSVYARILPEQKLRLVKAFKAAGEVVAMTGDGVNDAPALKAAHIGISMGQRGTDVAREASALVLLTDDLSALVHAIRMGRRIYDNLRKALTYVVAAHLPIAGMALLPLLLGTPLALAPVHIVFLEMIINPACAIVFESEAADADLMRRAPRRPDTPLLGLRGLAFAVLQGAGLLAVVAAVYFIGLARGLAPGQARAMAFICLVSGNLALMMADRSLAVTVTALLGRTSRTQWGLVAGAGLVLAAALSLPQLRQLFHFAALPGAQVLTALLLGAALTAWFELMKYLHR